jgi:hypothetical protein
MKKRSLFEKAMKAVFLVAILSGVTFLSSCEDDDEDPLKAEITAFSIVDAGPDQATVIEGAIEGTNITVAVPFESDLTALTPEIVLSTGATVTPQSGTTLDFTESRNFVVENGELQNTYAVTVAKAEPTGPVLQGLELASANTEEVYETTVDLLQDRINVTYNELQSHLVYISAIEVGPEGATYETSTGKDTLDLSIDASLTVNYAGESKQYTLVPEVTTAGFDVETATVLIDKSSASQAVPTEISDDKSRGADFNGQYVFVASRLNGNFIHYWDINATVDEVKNLSMEGVEGGGWAISDVKCVGDAIYASNMVMAAQGAEFKVYKWANVDATPEVVLTYITTADNQRLGDALSIVGDPSTNGKIIASNFPGWGGNAEANEFYVFQADGGEFGAPVVWDLALEEAVKVGQYGRVNEIPGADGLYLATGAEMGITLLDDQGNVVYEVPESVIQFRSYDPQVFEYNGGRYLSYTINREWETSGAFSQIINITEGADIEAALRALTDENIDQKLLYTNVFSGGLNDPWVNANNAVAMDEEGNPMIFSFSVLNGFMVEEFSR